MVVLASVSSTWCSEEMMFSEGGRGWGVTELRGGTWGWGCSKLAASNLQEFSLQIEITDRQSGWLAGWLAGRGGGNGWGIVIIDFLSGSLATSSPRPPSQSNTTQSIFYGKHIEDICKNYYQNGFCKISQASHSIVRFLEKLLIGWTNI